MRRLRKRLASGKDGPSSQADSMTSINVRYPRKGFLGAEDVREGDLTLQIAGLAWDEAIGNGKYGDVVRWGGI